ncbi:thromboxane-A synthase isoform X2 [Kryptolebias marmoratus]|uniref:Thromboxane-A synthase n=1 Tax=Kryptolebias marmoratus TaxID=37003 RepID=A0A2L0EBV2_KRYMA|nr:thromboxane-A synthase isoform X2 [Kryptolebias marmoratus]AUX14925.1 cytochrome p450 CYP5A4 [Kryptolebias marmoratus]
MLMFREGFLKPLSEIVKTHGKVCGYYLGRKPMVVIADPDILRQVMVKDFNNFTNRRFQLTTKPWKDCLLMLRNEQWKRVRSVVTPTFSAAKLKEMVPLINTATDALMNNLSVHAESGKVFDIHKCFQCFTMDVIASVAFGTNLDSQNNPDDPFVHYAQMFFAMSFFKPLVLFSILFSKIMAPLVRIIPNKRREEIDKFFISSIKKIIKQREEQPPDQRRRDFLQLILDARTGQESVSLEHFDTTKHSDELDNRSQQTPLPVSDQKISHPHIQKSSTGHLQKKTITEDEIVGQAFVFFLAGYETTSSTLGFACYLLALHPECQSKVQEEVDDFFTRHDFVDYTNVQELKYLDMAVCEALRIYPPGFRFNREVYHDCVINGQFFPKGATLELFSGFLHHDPEHWPEPKKFIPERFTPEAKANRHPFVYLPFGAGPRNCVGMRLAQLEIRMALAHLFHRFSVVSCSETKVPLDLKTFSTTAPKNGIFVKITRRNV